MGHIAAVRAYAANLRGDAAHTLEMATLTQTYLPNEYLTARGMANYALADTYFASDDMPQAKQALQDMLKVGEKTGQLMLKITALCELAAIDKVQGRLNQAEKRYVQARQWLVAHSGLNSRVRCAYEFGLADLLYARNQLDAAYEHAMIGIDLRQRLGGYWVVGDLPLIRILQARGDVEGALRVLYEAEQIVQTHHFQMTSLIAFKTARVKHWLAVGDVETASHWANVCNGDSELEKITLAHLRLTQERASEALNLLEQQRVLTEAGKRTGRLIEILSLEALALDALQRRDEAVTLLSQSLALARPEGYVRVYVDLGKPMVDLLVWLETEGTDTNNRKATMTDIVEAYARELLDAIRQQDTAQEHSEAKLPITSCAAEETLLDPLTERELEVLGLLAEGLPNKKIADTLIVAPSTIKQHLKNIYSKLDVHSRTQAVARGQELGLL